jgi:N-acetylglucosaminyldiphosphoundecaprenol N-acetyl-beta-D-mannosaminyltransferase
MTVSSSASRPESQLGRASATPAEEPALTAIRRPAPGPAAQSGASKHDFLDVGVSCLSDEAFLATVREAVETKSRLAVSFINPYYALMAHRTPALAEKIKRFDIVLPDGWGIVLGGRWLGIPILGRQANDDICPKLFALSGQLGYSNFLFGGPEGTAERAAANLGDRFPDLKIAGTLHGYWPYAADSPEPFRDADIKLMADTINASGADILHVSLPTPMQQDWVWEMADKLNVSVIITGGGYLDHLSERVDWYPGWVNKMRLGWVYRVYREPRRLWKRYTLDLLAYGGLLLRQKLARRPAPSP